MNDRECIGSPWFGRCCPRIGSATCGTPGEPCRGPGRPFIAHGVSRKAASNNYNNRKGGKYAASWKSGPEPSIPANNPYNEEIGRHWLQMAEGEHASIASFARFTLQLMSLGSPSGLLVASQKAEMDEINHAKYAYAFASAFLGSNYGPGSLDVKGTLDDVSLEYTVRSLIQEGCIGETISAIEAHVAAHYSQDSVIKTAMIQIASDETRHAQLAWDCLRWIIETFPEALIFAQDTFKSELKQRFKLNNYDVSMNSDEACEKNNCESGRDDFFRKSGIILQQDKDKANKVGIQNIIAPVYHSGFEDVSLISKKILELKVDCL